MCRRGSSGWTPDTCWSEKQSVPKLAAAEAEENLTSAPSTEHSHFLDKGGVWVGEDVSFLSTQIAAGDVEVDPQVGVVSFYRHTDVLAEEPGEHSERLLCSAPVSALPCRYLDGGDVEWCGDTKDGHDDCLVFFVDEDLHVSDVFFSGHLGDVLVGDV